MTKKEQSKQTMWETWLVISLVLLIIVFITGTMENSKIDFPNWPYFAGTTILNLIVCLKIGTHVSKE